MKNMKWIGMGIIFAVLLFGAGFLTRHFTMKPEIKIVKKTEVKYKTIYRDYTAPDDELRAALKCYDTSTPRLDGYMVGRDIFRAKAGLCERDWERDFTMKAHEKGNWRVTVGVSVASFIVGAVAGGVVGHYIPHNFSEKK